MKHDTRTYILWNETLLAPANRQRWLISPSNRFASSIIWHRSNKAAPVFLLICPTCKWANFARCGLSSYMIRVLVIISTMNIYGWSPPVMLMTYIGTLTWIELVILRQSNASDYGHGSSILLTYTGRGDLSACPISRDGTVHVSWLKGCPLSKSVIKLMSPVKRQTGNVSLSATSLITLTKEWSPCIECHSAITTRWLDADNT